MLIAMVVSDEFLARVVPKLEVELLETPHTRLIAEWCVEHFKKHGKAPNKGIETRYARWSEGSDNEGLVSNVHDLLEQLSNQYDRGEELNVPYLLDEFGAYLEKKRLQRLRTHIDDGLIRDNVEDIRRAVVEYKSLDLSAEIDGDDPITATQEEWNEVFSEDTKPLIQFEGDAGRFFNPVLTRDALVAIQAPEKCGKTWWCIEFMMRALRARRKVAFFQMGDLSKRQLWRRLASRWAQRPQHPWQCKEPIAVPYDIIFDDELDSGYTTESEKKRIRKTITSRDTFENGLRRVQRACGLAKDTQYLRVAAYPMRSLNVGGISSRLDQWKQELDFVADVIIIDYADILAPEDARKQQRDAVNETWMALRKLSQERHALVITPTQAKATTYSEKQDLQTMEDFSEDKRKYGHVTAMFGLNQTPDEREFNGMRLNWLVIRESPYNPRTALYVGTCFALGRALCCAKFRPRES